MSRRLNKRWRTVAREKYIKHGDNKQAIRAEIRQEYGSIMTVLAIIQAVFWLIDLWKKLKVHEPSETPYAEEADLFCYTDDEEDNGQGFELGVQDGVV